MPNAREDGLLEREQRRDPLMEVQREEAAVTDNIMAAVTDNIMDTRQSGSRYGGQSEVGGPVRPECPNRE